MFGAGKRTYESIETFILSMTKRFHNIDAQNFSYKIFATFACLRSYRPLFISFFPF